MDWIAGIFELCGDWLVGNKWKWGFLIKLIGAIAWLYVAVKNQLWGLLLAIIPALFVNVRNFLKWRQNELAKVKKNTVG